MALDVKTLRQQQEAKEIQGAIISDRRLWLTKGRDHVVEDGDPAARFLLAGPGSMVSKAEAERLGLTVVNGAVKAKPKPKDKARKKPEDKAGGKK